MSSTLSERVKERMTATGLNNAQLAAAAGVSQPSSFNWANGKTKQIKGEPLLAAARALGVTPEWLSTGKGPKLRDLSYGQPAQTTIAHKASDVTDATGAFNVVSTKAARARALLDKLPPAALEEAILQMEWLLEKHKKTNGSNGNSNPLPTQGRR